jgi:hypothetical protein
MVITIIGTRDHADRNAHHPNGRNASVELDELHEGVSHSLTKDRNLEETRPLELTRESAERQRVATAMRVGSLAAAAHNAAGDLDEQFPQAARNMRDAASGFEHISSLLRDPNLDEVATLIGNLGRKQPTAIVAGVVLIGLRLSWCLRNSGDAAHRIAPAAASEGTEGAYGIH